MDSERDRKLREIVDAVRRGNFVNSMHGEQRTKERHILEHEIFEALAEGEIIEDYPNDARGASCLVLGRTMTGRIVHIVCSMPPIVQFITAYEPNPARWEQGFRTRRMRP